VRGAPVRPGVPAAPAAPVAAAPARAGARRRDRDRDHDDEEDDGRRRPARRSGSGAGIGVLVGGGVLLLIVVMFLFITNLGGASGNALAIQRAKKVAATGDYQGAVDVLERHGDPSDRDGYVSVARLLAQYRGQVAGKKADALHKESQSYFDKEIHRPYVEQHKNKIPDEELARRIRDFLAKYPGTPTAVDLERSPYPPYSELRALLERSGGR
jgi:hypothetical protein